MIHCITVPSKTSKSGTALLWSSIRDMNQANTIRAFLNTRGEGKPWSHWQSLGYECMPLCLNNDIVFQTLAQDVSELSSGVRLTPQSITVEFTQNADQPSSEVVPDGAVCVLGDGEAQHLPQTQEGPAQAVDG